MTRSPDTPIERDADINNELLIAARYDSPDVIKQLIARGANINSKNKYGDTALIIAAEHKNPDILRLLIDEGADIDSRNNNGDTALIRATQRSNPDTLRLLIDKGADIDIKNNNGLTALLMAEEGATKNYSVGVRDAYLLIRQLLRAAGEARQQREAAAEEARISYVSDPHLHRDMPRPKPLRFKGKTP